MEENYTMGPMATATVKKGTVDDFGSDKQRSVLDALHVLSERAENAGLVLSFALLNPAAGDSDQSELAIGGNVADTKQRERACRDIGSKDPVEDGVARLLFSLRDSLDVALGESCAIPFEVLEVGGLAHRVRAAFGAVRGCEGAKASHRIFHTIDERNGHHGQEII